MPSCVTYSKEKMPQIFFEARRKIIMTRNLQHFYVQHKITSNVYSLCISLVKVQNVFAFGAFLGTLAQTFRVVFVFEVFECISDGF